MSSPIPSLSPFSDPKYLLALSAIDAAHAQDPTLYHPPSGSPIPHELHYAHQMTSFLHLHTPHASPLLHLAVRAQHLRRWEIPRSSYPPTKPGYLAWRAFLKKRQAAQAEQICLESGYEEQEAKRVGQLVRKEGLGRDEEVGALEDVACLVFLQEGLEGFEVGEEGKVVGVLRRTWGKMGERERELVGGLEMGERGRWLLGEALGGPGGSGGGS